MGGGAENYVRPFFGPGRRAARAVGPGVVTWHTGLALEQFALENSENVDSELCKFL